MENKLQSFVETIAYEKNKSLRILLYQIFCNTSITADKAVELLKITKDKINNLIEKNNLIVGWFFNGETIYTFKPEFCAELVEECTRCKFHKDVIIKIEGKEIKHIECSWEKLLCSINNVRRCFGATKVFRTKGYKIIGRTSLKQHEVKETEKKPVKDWSRVDFYKYYRKLHKEIFKENPFLKRFVIERKLGEFLEHLYSKIGNNEETKLKVKKYIQKEFELCKTDGKMVSLNKIVSVGGIKEVTKMRFPRFCTCFKLYCTYWVDGKCELEEEGNVCTEFLRGKMKKKYN